MSPHEISACLEGAGGDDIVDLYDIAFAGYSSGYGSESSGVIGKF